MTGLRVRGPVPQHPKIPNMFRLWQMRRLTCKVVKWIIAGSIRNRTYLQEKKRHWYNRKNWYNTEKHHVNEAICKNVMSGPVESHRPWWGDHVWDMAWHPFFRGIWIIRLSWEEEPWQFKFRSHPVRPSVKASWGPAWRGHINGLQILKEEHTSPPSLTPQFVLYC